MRRFKNVNYYAVLGVPSHASKDEIRTAYRELARRTHPDAGGEAERFAQIAEAWEILSDDDERELYDAERSLQARAARPYTDVRARAGEPAPSASRHRRSPPEGSLSETERWMKNKRRL